MLKIQENVDNKIYSTFKIGGSFRYFVEIDKNEIERRFKLNNTIKALGSSKLSKQYEDISILYEKQLLEFGKMRKEI